MSSMNESTTLMCLFHHEDQARAARNDLYQAGIPQSSVSTIDGDTIAGNSGQTLESLGVPSRDLRHLREALDAGGTIIAVSAISDHVSAVERIFGEHRASKIDETVSDNGDRGVLPVAAAAGETAIPIVQEELEVGKRTVDQGGVRVYRRVIEIPAEETVALREEHVTVERKAVDRAATPAELDAQGNRSIELTETAEEAVVSKNARVIEEVVVGKETGQRTEHIQDTVRRTEVEVEQLPPVNTRSNSNSNDSF